MSSERQRLIQILRSKSLKLGHFKLVSGKSSHYYFDSKPTTLDPEGAYLTARLILQELQCRGVQADAIGGLTLGADPIVSSIAAVSFIQQSSFSPLHAFIVRKEAKQHGTEQYIEGIEPRAGMQAIIVDDVCTTGSSTLKAIERAEQAGMQVVAVFCLVDRQQGGAEALKDYPFVALFTASELLDTPEIQGRLAELQGHPTS